MVIKFLWMHIEDSMSRLYWLTWLIERDPFAIKVSLHWRPVHLTGVQLVLHINDSTVLKFFKFVQLAARKPRKYRVAVVKPEQGLKWPVWWSSRIMDWYNWIYVFFSHKQCCKLSVPQETLNMVFNLSQSIYSVQHSAVNCQIGNVQILKGL